MSSRVSEASTPIALIERKTRNWWQDERRHWCAYCGTALAKAAGGRPTRDHVIPRKHKGRHVTIPACQACNVAKADKGLPEFMVSGYFARVRAAGKPRMWPLRDLWLVMALAAVHQAKDADP